MKDNFTPLELLALSAACESDPEADVAFDQLTKVVVTKRELTGCGSFTHFKTASKLLLTSTDGKMLRGSQRVSLTHPELPHGADVIVWLTEGKMDCLELLAFGGEDLPDGGDFEIQYSPTGE